MKRIAFSLLLLSAIIGTSCSDDNENQKGIEEGTEVVETANLRVSIAGQPSSRYVGEGSTTNNPAVESFISNFTVFVFNYISGDLEKSQSFSVTPDNYSGQVTGLSTGTGKRVVAFVNVPDDLDLSTITRYDQLHANMLTLDSQNSPNLATTGLFMSGETTESITLTSDNQQNNIIIPVRRRVAKIILKSLKINVDPTTLPNFSLTGISVQKARLTGTPLGTFVPPTGDVTQNYAGGIASPASANPNFNLTRYYLLEGLQLPANYQSGAEIITSTAEERYFYVLANSGINGNGTLLTLAGKYGSVVENAYYPFVINSTYVEGGTDGKFIECNKKYALSVVINKPASPSEDPNEVPSMGGTLEVTITPEEWTTQINQDVEW
ncbi:fimbrial protein [uncultured Bacteroides sp.]|uniref:fimbrial protein n=1 Tax=uncultured Bacteroides sp. TaxID=162156 RepID=UPI0025E0F246|nr:fimbrial protein [uncultured Bacteroides sp.]